MNILILDATSESLVVQLTEAHTTSAVVFTVTYGDVTTSGMTEGNSVVNSDGTNEVTLCAAPASSTKRLIRNITVYNGDTVAHTAKISLLATATRYGIRNVLLNAGESWSFGTSAYNKAYSHTALSNIGTNTHPQIDTFISSKASASGIASLDGSSKVVQDPANSTTTSTASKIPIADGSGKIDTWVSDASETVKGKVELATTAEATTGTDTTRAVTPAGANAAIKGVVSAQFWLSGAGITPSTTAGCALPAITELATNKVNIKTADFDQTTQEHGEWTFAMPSDYGGGTVTAIFHWTANSTSTNSVIWGLQGRCFGDDDALDQAWGTAQEVTDANKSTAHDVNITSATSAITLAGTPAAGKLAQWRIYRKAADGSDTLDADAKLFGVQVTYTRT